MSRQEDNRDTHGEAGEGWIGFDLDGTLARYDGWKGISHIGEPIGPMVDLIKKLHGQGRYVKIVTARVAPQKLEDGTFGEPYITVPQGDGGATRQYASQYIQDWCHFNLGFVPEIVYQKDRRMLELYDDRTKQAVPNTGILVEDALDASVGLLQSLRELLTGVKETVDVWPVHGKPGGALSTEDIRGVVRRIENAIGSIDRFLASSECGKPDGGSAPQSGFFSWILRKRDGGSAYPWKSNEGK